VSDMTHIQLRGWLSGGKNCERYHQEVWFPWYHVSNSYAILT